MVYHKLKAALAAYRSVAEMRMVQGQIRIGARVTVVNQKSPYHGLSGLVEAPASSDAAGGHQPQGRRWHLVFDYPLGGVAGRTVVAEDEVEVVSGALHPSAIFRE